MDIRAWHRLCYPAVVVVLSGLLYEPEAATKIPPKAEHIIREAIADSHHPVHGAEDEFDTTGPNLCSPIAASGAASRYKIVATPVINGGWESTPEPEISVRLSVHVRGEQRNPPARFFSSCCDFRAEMLQNNLLQPDDFESMIESVLRGYQWVSPSLVPLTDRELKSLKLRQRNFAGTSVG